LTKEQHDKRHAEKRRQREQAQRIQEETNMLKNFNHYDADI